MWVSYFLEFPLTPRIPFTAILCVLAVCLYYSHVYFSKTGKILYRHFRGGFPIPLIGNSYLMLGPAWKTQGVIEDYFRKYGKSATFWHLTHPHILTKDVEIAQAVLGSPDLFEKGKAYDMLTSFLGVGLLTSSGKRWLQDRKALNRGFDRTLFDFFVSNFSEHSITLVEQLRQESIDNEPKYLYPYLIASTLDSIFETALGTKVGVQEETGSTNKYSHAFSSLAIFSHYRLFKPYLYLIPGLTWLLGWEKIEREHLKLFFDQAALAKQKKEAEMKMQMQQNKQSSSKPNAQPFLQILLEQQPPPTDKEYGEHLLTIIAAGSETTGSSIYQTLFYLALHPQHQQKCQEEVDEILADGEMEITLAHISRSKYIEMCWMETMRLRPPLPLVSRRLTRDVQLKDGRVLPRGVDVTIGIYDIHRDPDLYPDPVTFDPSRFQEKGTNRHPYSYLPFSKGNRNCIGLRFARLEALVILMRILKRFTISTKQKNEDIKIIFGVPVQTYPKVKIALSERNNNKN